MVKSDKTEDSRSPSPWDPAVALVLLTRLPLPALPERCFARQARAAWAFPLVGLVVALLAGLAGWLAMGLGLPAGIAAGVVLATQIVLTGAMHEDGLADSCDGLWGGYARERRLEIMRDSVIGTYGVLGLVISVGLRWQALALLLPVGIGGLIAAAVLSRGLLPALMTALPPARSDGLSKGVGVPGWDTAGVALILGLGIALFAGGAVVLLPALVAVLGVVAVSALAKAKLGGQTGDILGAAQQVAEVVILLGLVAQI